MTNDQIKIEAELIAELMVAKAPPDIKLYRPWEVVFSADREKGEWKAKISDGHVENNGTGFWAVHQGDQMRSS